jgi:hypothetical protein
MIDHALNILSNKLNRFFQSMANVSGDNVAFIDGGSTNPLVLPLNKVTPLLINIEEERTLRQADRYESQQHGGIRVGGNPEVRISLLLLFIARFSDYEQSLKFISLVIQFFQSNRIFDHENTPDLPAEIDYLRMELQTMPIAQQNDLWHALHTTYLPSVSYRLSLLVYRDQTTISISSPTTNVETTLSQE